MLVPIRVGMIPSVIFAISTQIACPHTRGDDPVFEQRRWTCEGLVPIRVGMILTYISWYIAIPTCPHTRGDDPKFSWRFPNFFYLSPYAWGWSYNPINNYSMEELVPIRVGMILCFELIGCHFRTCPHTRGDDPGGAIPKNVTVCLSPYAWGWSCRFCFWVICCFLVPIRVGMIP